MSQEITTIESLKANHIGLINDINRAYKDCETFEKEFVLVGALYPLAVLRTGALLHEFKAQYALECPRKPFSQAAELLFPHICKATRENYMKAFTNLCVRGVALEEGTASHATPSSDDEKTDEQDDTIEAEVIDAPTNQITLKQDAALRQEARTLPLSELFRGTRFDAYIGDKSACKSLFSRVKYVMGDRSITKLYRESGAVPDLKRKQGKARGQYAKTIARRTTTHLGKVQQITAMISALDKDGASNEVWRLLRDEIAPIFEKHGLPLTTTTNDNTK